MGDGSDDEDDDEWSTTGEENTSSSNLSRVGESATIPPGRMTLDANAPPRLDKAHLGTNGAGR